MRRSILVFAFTVFLLFEAAPGLAAVPDEDPTVELEVFGPAVMTGHSEFRMTEGVALFRSQDPTSIRLNAESLVIRQQWEKGLSMGADDNLLDVVTDEGSEKYALENGAVRFDVLEGKDGVFLPYSDGEGRIISNLLGRWRIEADSSPEVLGVGDSPDTEGAGEAQPLGFWFEASGPQVVGTGGGTVRVDGSFTIFVHDVWIEASGSNGAWTDWTGFREYESESPLSAEYEFRITTIKVKNGTLLASPGELELYSPVLKGTIDGDLTAPSATGRLLQDDFVYLFEEDTLHLKGSGTMDFQAVEGSQGDRADLFMKPEGDFEVHGASTVESVETSGGLPGIWLLFASLGGLVVASACSTGLARQGRLPAPRFLRESWHHQAMERGRYLMDHGRYLPAASAYQRATRLQSADPLAWYEWAHAELLCGRMERVDEVANRAKGVPGMDPLDLLDLQASAALARGQMVLFETYMQSIAREAPELAQGLIKELDVDPSKLSPELRGMIGSGYVKGPEGDIDGYA